jgi:hypothetical protein
VSINPQDGMSFYLQTIAGGVTGASQADAIAFHPYLGPSGPERIAVLITRMQQTMSTVGVAALPLWDSESSWGANHNIPGCPAGDLGPFSAACKNAMATFVARSLLLGASTGLDHFCWYMWDNTGHGTLWTTTDGDLPGAAAHARIQGWITGAAPQGPCTATPAPAPNAATNNSVCVYEKPDGSIARAVWNDQGAASFLVPAGVTRATDLGGVVAPTSGGATLQISQSPILLE